MLRHRLFTLFAILAISGCQIPLDFGDWTYEGGDGGGASCSSSCPELPPATLDQLFFDPALDTLVAGDSDTLRLHLVSNYGVPYWARSITITTSDSSVAAMRVVDSTPPMILVIHAVAGGTAVLTASADGRTATAAITVVAASESRAAP